MPEKIGGRGFMRSLRKIANAAAGRLGSHQNADGRGDVLAAICKVELEKTAARK